MKTEHLKRTFAPIISLALLSAAIPAHAADAPTTLPVSFARSGFTPEQVEKFHANWEWESIFKTGDASVYAFLHFSEFYRAATLRRTGSVVGLERALNPEVGAIHFKSALGEMSLDEYLGNPGPRAQGMIVVHEGKIAFEMYPGMRDDDAHVLFSVGKTTVSLVISLLEADGKVDVQQTVGTYVPALKGTAWDGIKVVDVLDMASGLDVLESGKARMEVTSAFGRFARAIFNEPSLDGKLETQLDVLRSVKKLRDPGEVFQYSSLNTQVLVLLAEAVEHRPWPQIFQERVWSKINAEGDAFVTVTAEGTATPVGFVSMRLRDMARFGMLYTPSWNRAAREQVVSADMLKKIQTGGRPALYPKAAIEHMVTGKTFGGDAPVANSRQWDSVFADGDFFKGGMSGQGLYVSPGKDLVIAWFSTTGSTSLDGYARAISKRYAGGH